MPRKCFVTHVKPVLAQLNSIAYTISNNVPYPKWCQCGCLPVDTEAALLMLQNYAMRMCDVLRSDVLV